MPDPGDSAEPPSHPSVDKLLVEHLPGLRAYVRLRSGPLVRGRESSSDLVQSVCAELLTERSRFEFRGADPFRRWLYRTAEHKIVDRARHWNTDKRDVAREADDLSNETLLSGYASLFTPSRHACAREEIVRLETTFDSLPEQYREIIVQSRYLGMSHSEIAEQSGRTDGAVRTTLCRALARLSDLLAEPE